MDVSGKRIGFALTGSFCTIGAVLPQMQRLADMGAEIMPVFSYSVNEMNTRFFTVQELKSRVTMICGRAPVCSIVDAEPIGPKNLLDAIVIAPCTGNSMSKLAAGITDTPVLMAAKAAMRNGRPVIIAPATNDGLGANAKTIGALMNTKNIYFVPFGQDGYMNKRNSLQALFTMIPAAIDAALDGRQLQPVLLGPGDLAI